MLSYRDLYHGLQTQFEVQFPFKPTDAELCKLGTVSKTVNMVTVTARVLHFLIHLIPSYRV